MKGTALMDRDKAIDAFMNKIVVRAYKGAIAIVTQLVEDGPLERNPSAIRTALHTWYEKLDTNQQEMVRQTIKETAYSAVFGCLVVLDNRSGGYPLEGELSDFALLVQRYTDSEAYSANQVEESVRINDLSNQGIDLHDLLGEHIAKIWSDTQNEDRLES